MPQCILCNNSSQYISKEIKICLNCIRKFPDDAIRIAQKAHQKSRKEYGLPIEPPHSPHGLQCNICMNECSISKGEIGYCGLRKNEDGRIVGPTREKGKLSWYHDPLPTNCVADWVCPGGAGSGYPVYAYRDGPEYEYKNLAVFFHACSFNCLYCQNWYFKETTLTEHTTSVESLLDAIDNKTSCICYFGGDPSPQLPFAIHASKIALKKNKGRILRICWETNGSMNKALLNEMIELSIISGGCIKFDIKAWDEDLHMILTGVTNRRTLENFKLAGEWSHIRKSPPLLVASTLLVPEYIDEIEIKNIARFIASINPEIPYALLAFYPHFYMSDMPLTSKRVAERCLEVAIEEGLKNVRIGNVHLLKD